MSTPRSVSFRGLIQNFRRASHPLQSSAPPREIKKPTPASRLAGTPGQYFQSPEAGHVASQTMQTADCAVGLATSCRWIPKKLPIKVCKSCQKVAIFSKSCRKVAEKLPKFFCFSYLFWVLKIKNSHIASYQNFICQSPMKISEVLSISLDQQIVYQNDMNKTWLYTHIMSRIVFMWRVALHSFSMKSIHVWLSLTGWAALTGGISL